MVNQKSQLNIRVYIWTDDFFALVLLLILVLVQVSSQRHCASAVTGQVTANLLLPIAVRQVGPTNVSQRVVAQHFKYSI